MRCRNCKEKFEPIRFNQKFCLKEDCVRVWVASEKDKQWKKTKAKAKLDLMTIQDYIKLAQQVFNKYIRLNEIKLGNPCFSCRKPLTSKFDAGHFMNANNHWNVRFDERNVHAQCVYCNQHLHGNLLEYRKQLEFYYGSAWVAQLESDARKTRKFTKDELKEIIEIYKKKIKEI